MTSDDKVHMPLLHHDRTFDYHFALMDLYGDKKLTDFTIHLAGGKSIQCHKLVLYLNSKFFETFFNSQFEDSKENEMSLEHLDGQSVEDILDFIYLGQLQVQWENMDTFVDVAAFLDVRNLLEKCDKYVYWKLTPDNASYWYSKTFTHNLPRVRERLETEFLQHLTQTDEFKNHNLDYMCGVLKSNQLELEEDQVFDVAMSWWNENKEKDKEYSILSNIYTSKLSEKYLKKYSEITGDKSVLKTKTDEKDEDDEDEDMEDDENQVGQEETRLIHSLSKTPVLGRNEDDNYKVLLDLKVNDEHRKHWVTLRMLSDVPDDLRAGSLCSLSKHGLIMCGGEETTGRLCAMFHAIKMKWVEMPWMVEGRSNHTCVELDNKMYVVGGNQDQDFDPGTLCLDLSDITWMKYAPLPESQLVVNPSGCVAGNGRIFILGYKILEHMQDLSDQLHFMFYQFSIEENRWENIALPPRKSFLGSALAFYQGKVYIGATKHKFMEAQRKLYVYEYDPVTKVIELVFAMKDNRIQGCLSLYGTDLFVYLNDEIYRFNYSTNTLSEVTAEIPLARVDRQIMDFVDYHWVSQKLYWAKLALPQGKELSVDDTSDRSDHDSDND